jgi:uncharacterized membrane protein
MRLVWISPPSGFDAILATSVSSKGEYVAGVARNDRGNARAFWWSLSDGIVILPIPSTYTGSEAIAVSADGSIVAGNLLIDNRPTMVRWSLGGQPEILQEKCEARAMSTDGQIIVGRQYRDDGKKQAIVWTPNSGVCAVFEPDASHESELVGISADGKIMVGQIVVAPGVHRSFMYRNSISPEFLNCPCEVSALSGDGTTLVGRIRNRKGRFEPCASTLSGTVRTIRLSVRFVSGWALGVSYNGNTQVGVGYLSDGRTTAFGATPTTGARILDEVYTPFLAGGSLSVARSVSADGRYIVGWGQSRVNRTEAYWLDTGF